MRPLTDPATYCLIICALAFGLVALMTLAQYVDGLIAKRRDEHLAMQHDREG